MVLAKSGVVSKCVTAMSSGASEYPALNLCGVLKAAGFRPNDSALLQWEKGKIVIKKEKKG
jgi:hypothetical protein